MEQPTKADGTGDRRHPSLTAVMMFKLDLIIPCPCGAKNILGPVMFDKLELSSVEVIGYRDRANLPR